MPDAAILGATVTVTPLITIPQLEIVAREPVGSLTNDVFAKWVVEAASALVTDTARCPGWETDAAAVIPREARRIALMVAKRTFQNPDQIVAEGSIGPIGGDRVADIQAMGMNLSEAEREVVEGLCNSPALPAGSSMWLQPIADIAAYDRTAYIADDSGGDWQIPYGDFGSTDAFNETWDIYR